MTRIESEKVMVAKSAKEIYEFLSDFNNFEKLMPEQVTNWNSSTEECSFTVAGMASLGMKLIEKNPFSLIKAGKHGNAPFDFMLSCHINEKGNQSEVGLVFEADLNPMLKMMAERPLTNFINMLVNKMKSV
ncbi:MAG: SRPBCC family protein [Bacteroidota bacterium]